MNLFDDSSFGADESGVFPIDVWERVFLPRILISAEQKSRDRTFPDGEDFVAKVVETLYRRNVEGRGLRSVTGIPRAVENCANDWIRWRKRPKNRAPSIDDMDFDPAIEGDASKTKLQLTAMEREFPWLLVVGAAIEVGFSHRVIADAFELAPEDFEAKLEIERELASLVFDGDNSNY